MQKRSVIPFIDGRVQYGLDVMLAISVPVTETREFVSKVPAEGMECLSREYRATASRHNDGGGVTLRVERGSLAKGDESYRDPFHAVDQPLIGELRVWRREELRVLATLFSLLAEEIEGKDEWGTRLIEGSNFTAANSPAASSAKKRSKSNRT